MLGPYTQLYRLQSKRFPFAGQAPCLCHWQNITVWYAYHETNRRVLFCCMTLTSKLWDIHNIRHDNNIQHDLALDRLCFQLTIDYLGTCNYKGARERISHAQP